ncbi:hypothetical protein CTI12_AA219940 [Artemisia annua]|uniref:Uncharacterized protein n=1 Tax=Artemisia annua TaxID=35608 RepID=A0A2U1KZE1_ARTAN|nr:hypothetical protein CTI12_AA546800 [Artemisia annua]PWA77929.1 hypothetical protein CTI12_AA219940 [Artemisia annua]
MSFGNLAIALTIIFIVSIIALVGELLYVLWWRRSFRRHVSPPQILPETLENPVDLATKELQYFFCLKPHAPAKLEPCEPPNKNTNGSVPDDEEVDVFKLLEASGPKRFLSTIKEEDVESTIDVDSASKVDIEDEATMQTCVELNEAVVVVEKDENTKTVFSTPCDSPYFTPVGSPSRDVVESDQFVVLVDENEKV